MTTINFEHHTMTYMTVVRAGLAEMADARARIVGKSKSLLHKLKRVAGCD